jgi:hypothetical protein
MLVFIIIILSLFLSVCIFLFLPPYTSFLYFSLCVFCRAVCNECLILQEGFWHLEHHIVLHLPFLIYRLMGVLLLHLILMLLP